MALLNDAAIICGPVQDAKLTEHAAKLAFPRGSSAQEREFGSMPKAD
jgi:hypothetical protein